MKRNGGNNVGGGFCPMGLILHTNGTFSNVALPNTAQELTTMWTNPLNFPHGVVFHKMIHLNEKLKNEIVGTTNKTISLALLCNKPTAKTGVSSIHDCNFHELPPGLDTQLFYGNLMMILTIDGTTIVHLGHAQYKHILDFEIANVRIVENNSFSFSPCSFGGGATPPVFEFSPRYSNSPLRNVIRDCSFDVEDVSNEEMDISY